MSISTIWDKDVNQYSETDHKRQISLIFDFLVRKVQTLLFNSSVNWKEGFIKVQKELCLNEIESYRTLHDNKYTISVVKQT